MLLSHPHAWFDVLFSFLSRQVNSAKKPVPCLVIVECPWLPGPLGVEQTVEIEEPEDLASLSCQGNEAMAGWCLDHLAKVRKPDHHPELVLRMASALFPAVPRYPPAPGAASSCSAEGRPPPSPTGLCSHTGQGWGHAGLRATTGVPVHPSPGVSLGRFWGEVCLG